jgi:hypothetical protein
MGPKGIGPNRLGAPKSAAKQTGKSMIAKKKNDPNKFTRNYNATTGITHGFTQDDGGNSVTPGYDPKKADQYKANAIKKYGSLEASRKADESRNLSSKTKPREKTNRELYREEMRTQNDSLRKLPKTDKHHLPTFDTSTQKGLKAQKDFYTPSPKNQKLRDLKKLGNNLRKKHGI